MVYSATAGMGRRPSELKPGEKAGSASPFIEEFKWGETEPAVEIQLIDSMGYQAMPVSLDKAFNQYPLMGTGLVGRHQLKSKRGRFADLPRFVLMQFTNC